MKNALFLLFLAFVYSTSIHAQFNTVGHVDSRQSDNQSPPPVESMTIIKGVADYFEVNTEPQKEKVGDNDLMAQYLSVSFPLRSIKIRSKYGMRLHPILHKILMHNGVDMEAHHEEVLSILPGSVTGVGDDKRSGRFVTVQTANFTISYCHLSQQYVKVGNYVNAGDPLGMSGSTGVSTGEHLHITTKKDGKAFNPVILLDYVRQLKERCIALLAS